MQTFVVIMLSFWWWGCALFFSQRRLLTYHQDRRLWLTWLSAAIITLVNLASVRTTLIL
jgi:hypothetical protein